MQRFIPAIYGLLAVAIYSVWLAFPITVITADIGRHLADGRIFFEYPEWRSALLSTNFYSTAVTNYEIINHHWAAGIIFWMVKSVAGWKGLHLFHIALGIGAATFFLDIARRKSSFKVAIAVAVFLLPLIAYRHEVRPEYMGYLLLAALYWVLEMKKLRWSVPVMMLIWVNVHASFALGAGLVVLYVVSGLLRKPHIDTTFMAPAVLSVIAVCTNPSGIEGALYPLSILSDPGYAVFENQSISFLASIGSTSWQFTFLKVVMPLVAFGLCLLVMTRNIRDHIPIIMMSMLTMLMAWLAVRHISVVGFLLIPVLSIVIATLYEKWPTMKRGITICGLIAVCVSLGLQYKHLTNRWIVLGLEPTAENAAEFVIKNDIPGPYFNNFDIGGYMIHYLYPDKKPFVYNRPESHPSEFWTETYIPMMQDRTIWQQQLSEHKFNAIILFHGDRTTWAQDFLRATILDPEWAAVFVDRSVLVFVRRNGVNAELINQYEIPASRLIKS